MLQRRGAGGFDGASGKARLRREQCQVKAQTGLRSVPAGILRKQELTIVDQPLDVLWSELHGFPCEFVIPNNELVIRQAPGYVTLNQPPDVISKVAHAT
jgi:hypothetical protein